MAKSELEEIGNALNEMAQPKMSPKELLKAARSRFPKASRKTIVRAALYNVLANSSDGDKAKRLQNFALVQGGGVDD